MTAVIIILLALAALLSFRLGVDFKYNPEGVFLKIKIGPHKLTILPSEKKPEKKDEPKEEKKAEPDEDEEKKKSKLVPEKSEIKELIKMALETLGAFRRALCLEVFNLHYTLAGDDPYDTAIKFGRLNAAVGLALPVAEQVIKVKKRDIVFDVDFLAEKSIMDLQAVLTVRIGGVIHVALSLVTKFLNMKYRNR